MARKKQVKRGQNQRPEKTVILIGTEGNNKTEKKYYYALGQTVTDKYSVRFAKGNSTDPIGIIKDTIKSKEDYCTDPGDMAFAVFDLDTSPQKQVIIDGAVELANKANITIVSSTPCFEVWFLQHFKYSTHPFCSNSEVIDELRRYVPKYEKNMDIFPLIVGNTDKAIKRARALENHHDNLGRNKNSVTRNPSTNAHIIVELIVNNK